MEYLDYEELAMEDLEHEVLAMKDLDFEELAMEDLDFEELAMEDLEYEGLDKITVVDAQNFCKNIGIIGKNKDLGPGCLTQFRDDGYDWEPCDIPQCSDIMATQATSVAISKTFSKLFDIVSFGKKRLITEIVILLQITALHLYTFTTKIYMLLVTIYRKRQSFDMWTQCAWNEKDLFD